MSLHHGTEVFSISREAQIVSLWQSGWKQEGDLFIPRTLQMFGRLTAEEGSMCMCACVYVCV